MIVILPRTVEGHDFLDFAERIGSDARVLAEVVVVGDVDAETERQSVRRLVVDFDLMFRRRRAARQPPPVLRPVVHRVRKCRDDALQDRLAPTPLADASIRQVDLRRN